MFVGGMLERQMSFVLRSLCLLLRLDLRVGVDLDR